MNGEDITMVYTVTCNPSLDYIVSVDDLKPGLVNRTAKELIYAGGKGINVSIVLKNLGMASTALGFTGGFTGDEIERMLRQQEITADFVRVKEGSSRINVKIRAKEETEINGRGPQITEEELSQLYRKLDGLAADDILVLAGSIPSVLPQSLYGDLMEYLQQKKLRVVVDAEKDLLAGVLKYRPFLIKPNHHELGELFHKKLSSRDEIAAHARLLQEQGARNVLVSMAGEGAVLVAEDGSVWYGAAPKGRVCNSVGAGDSMVAGFLYGYLSAGDYEEALRWGICTGSASAFSEELAGKAEVEALLVGYHM